MPETIERHPEQTDDEIFIGNISPDSFDGYGWLTKRKGTRTFDIYGHETTGNGSISLFVNRSEIETSRDNPSDALAKERWEFALDVGRLPRHGDAALSCGDLREMMLAVRSSVQIRNQMGGAMYWNMCNDEACRLASRAITLGADREELSKLLGPGNFR